MLNDPSRSEPSGDADRLAAPPPEGRASRLGEWARVFALAIAMAGAAALLWRLLDVILLIFLGVTLAAALQPWHARLCRLGVPRGAAISLIYLVFALLLVGLGVLVLPALAEEMVRLLSTVPDLYTSLQATLRESRAAPLRLLGQRLPPFEVLPATMASPAESMRGIFGFTTGMLGLLTWIVTVLAVAFYWTLDVPRLERAALSMVSAARRPEALGAWREVEAKLGAYLRAQGIAMLVVGMASGIGYLVIGLPNPLALALLAGLCEGIPLIGPILAGIPAVLAALSVGTSALVATLSWTVLVQVVESNVLVPRLMSHAVGVSELVSLLAILALGSVYGVLGVFIAIPLAAVAQVLLDHLVLAPEAAPPERQRTGLAGLRSRARTLRQRMRLRLRERTGRMGIDPAVPEHVVDAVDQQLEEAAERLATLIRRVQRSGGSTDAGERTGLVAALRGALERLEHAVARMDAIGADAIGGAEPLPLDELACAAGQAERAVAGAESALQTAAEEAAPSRLDRA